MTFGLQADDAGSGRCLEPADRGGRRIQGALAVMPEGMPEVVDRHAASTTSGSAPVFAELTADLRNLEGGEAVRTKSSGSTWHLRLFRRGDAAPRSGDARGRAKLGALGGLVVLATQRSGIGGRVRAASPPSTPGSPRKTHSRGHVTRNACAERASYRQRQLPTKYCEIPRQIFQHLFNMLIVKVAFNVESSSTKRVPRPTRHKLRCGRWPRQHHPLHSTARRLRF